MSLRRLSAVAPLQGAYTSPGAMDQWITLLEPTGRNQDGSDQAYSPFATTFASIRLLQGQELYKAQQIVEEVTHLVTVPYQSGLNASMQIQVGTTQRIFQIKDVQDPDERQVELRLLCVERNQNG